MPVRTSQHAVLTPHALLPGAIAVLLACRATGWVGWTTPDAPAVASGLTRRAAIASSRLGCTTPAAAAVVRRPPRIVPCVPLAPSQVVGLRLPARHGRWAAWRQARGQRQRRWRRRRRRRARRRPLADRCSVVMYVCRPACVGRVLTLLRDSHARDVRTFHIHTCGTRLAAHRHARQVIDARRRSPPKAGLSAREGHKPTARSLRTPLRPPSPVNVLTAHIPATANRHDEYYSASQPADKATNNWV